MVFTTLEVHIWNIENLDARPRFCVESVTTWEICSPVMFSELIFLQAQKPLSWYEDIEKLLKEAQHPVYFILLKISTREWFSEGFYPCLLLPVQGWYIVTYALGIYHLNLFIAFLSPKVDPSLMEDSGMDRSSFLPSFETWSDF